MHFLILASLTLAASVAAFPPHASLAGLSNREIESIMPTLQIRGPEPAPGPLEDTSSKLVNNKHHPWKPLRPGDIRGPCPGINTLASHGYIDRSGVTTPGEIIKAVQEGFNMGNDLAVFVTYANMLVDGNHLTNLMSIGQKTPATGTDPPSPAIVGGLNTHEVFEGDASLTRSDIFFGDNHSFNETLFQEFVAFSDRFGAGKYNKTVAGELRFQRLRESIATNPNFTNVLPRFTTAYAESAFPFRLFVDGRHQDGQLDMTTARGFFQNSQMPAGFFRRNGSYGFTEVGNDLGDIQGAHPLPAGSNNGVNNYILDATFTSGGFCDLYKQFVGTAVPSLYPNPQGPLLAALKTNLQTFYSSVAAINCTQLFPYGP